MTDEKVQELAEKLATQYFETSDYVCDGWNTPMMEELAKYFTQMYLAGEKAGLEEAAKWVSVKERLPKEIENGYRWVQVYDKYWETIYDASFDGEKWEPNYDREAESEITHWRPFPPNPPPAAISDCATSDVEAARNTSKLAAKKEKA